MRDLSQFSHVSPPIPGTAPHLSHLSYRGEVEVGGVRRSTSPRREGADDGIRTDREHGAQRTGDRPLPSAPATTRQSADVSLRDQKNPPSASGHDALTFALQDLHELGQKTPCAGDARFTSGHYADRVEAVALCAGCPVLDPCRAAGELEDENVWGGVDRTKRPASKARPEEAA